MHTPHNPVNLTPEQIDPQKEGWRLLDSDEIVIRGPYLREIEMHGFGQENVNGWYVNCAMMAGGLTATYRTKLTRAELRKARGLPPAVLIPCEAKHLSPQETDALIQEAINAKPNCAYYSPTYGPCQLETRHDGCHAFDGHRQAREEEICDLLDCKPGEQVHALIRLIKEKGDLQEIKEAAQARANAYSTEAGRMYSKMQWAEDKAESLRVELEKVKLTNRIDEAVEKGLRAELSEAQTKLALAQGLIERAASLWKMGLTIQGGSSIATAMTKFID